MTIPNASVKSRQSVFPSLPTRKASAGMPCFLRKSEGVGLKMSVSIQYGRAIPAWRKGQCQRRHLQRSQKDICACTSIGRFGVKSNIPNTLVSSTRHPHEHFNACRTLTSRTERPPPRCMWTISGLKAKTSWMASSPIITFISCRRHSSAAKPPSSNPQTNTSCPAFFAIQAQ